MRKLLLVALVANVGLAGAAEPSSAAQPPPKGAGGAEALAGKAKPGKERGKAAPAEEKQDAAPAAKAGEPAGKPDEKPCEPVKPCPIDG